MVLLSKETVSFAFETDVLFWGLKDLLNPERCHLFISDIFITFTYATEENERRLDDTMKLS